MNNFCKQNLEALTSTLEAATVMCIASFFPVIGFVEREGNKLKNKTE
jgi:hypothetical protein